MQRRLKDQARKPRPLIHAPLFYGQKPPKNLLFDSAVLVWSGLQLPLVTKVPLLGNGEAGYGYGQVFS